MKFKPYNQNQTVLLPYSFDDLIPEKHPVRIVDQVVESINIQPLLKAYSKEGNPGYHVAQGDALCLYNQCLLFP